MTKIVEFFPDYAWGTGAGQLWYLWELFVTCCHFKRRVCNRDY